MSVQIHINGDNAGEAIRELAELASHLSPQQGGSVPTDAPKTNSRSRAATKTETVKETPADSKDETDTSSRAGNAANESDQGDDDAPIPTVVDLRAKAQEVGTTPEAKKAIKALLDEFESKSISDVPEDKRAAFMSGLAGLA